MKIDRDLNEKLIDNTHETDGNMAIEWALEAIAVALYRIANAIEEIANCQCEESARQYLEESVKIFGSK